MKCGDVIIRYSLCPAREAVGSGGNFTSWRSSITGRRSLTIAGRWSAITRRGTTPSSRPTRSLETKSARHGERDTHAINCRQDLSAVAKHPHNSDRAGCIPYYCHSRAADLPFLDQDRRAPTNKHNVSQHRSHQARVNSSRAHIGMPSHMRSEAGWIHTMLLP